jgi:hypothetical protein
VSAHRKITRNVPIEVQDMHEEQKGYRIDDAPFSTCVQCGASFYDTHVMSGVQTSLEPPKVPEVRDDYC